MESFEILFPLNLSPLAYSAPEELEGLITPGIFVKAEIKSTERIGLVLKRSSSPGVKTIKGIFEGPLISEALLKLIEWMSDYYIANKGLVLKTMYSREFFEVLSKKGHTCEESSEKERSQDGGRYQTLLFHITTMEQEFSLLSDLIKKGKNLIILSPEISQAERIAERLEPIAGRRVSLLHGDLTRKEKVQAYERIISGQSDVVIGTRISVFAPLKRVSHIIVLREEDSSYKNMQGVRYHGRDVAVMRGYIERAKVILTSAAPSVESYYNVMKGKYRLIRYGGKVRGQRIEIIDMNRQQKVSSYISKRAIEIAKKHISSGGKILFLINRKGYSLIRCRDCNFIEGCKICKVPLVYHKDRNQLLCHYCKRDYELKELCPICGGATLETIGAGTQRIETELKMHLGLTPLRLEKGLKAGEIRKRIEGIKEPSVIVSTGIIKQLLPERSFNACIFINPDSQLQFPDFRCGERLFQELNNMRDWIRPDGTFLIQTRFPENHIYRAFRRRSIDEFYSAELPMRKSLLYPPFSRFAVLTIQTRDIEEIKKVLSSLWVKEIVYSSEFHESERKKRHFVRLLLKSHYKGKLHDGIRDLISAIRDRSINITVDIDPL